ncbi:MAG: hypothetical protein CMM46_04725 [Rhodospirillaceae bacterium]|nr:hypothetical protein [Rhodospirillaceae bacterium]|tara:strand:+ start:10815 stop:11135 length:321 start_codon:yes stop_codon:yes gene_type:complete
MTSDIEMRLASSLGRRDEELNMALAENLCIQADARDRSLLAPHTKLFTRTIRSRDNRVVWGSLTALAAIATLEPEAVFAALDEMLAPAQAGSVIAWDRALDIRAAL